MQNTVYPEDVLETISKLLNKSIASDSALAFHSHSSPTSKSDTSVVSAEFIRER